MHKTLLAAVGAAFFLTSPAMADSPFDGTWKIDQSANKIDPKPVVFSLRSGTFHCATCEPAYSVKADGKVHAVKRDYIDAQRMTVVSPYMIRSEIRRDGKVMGGGTWTISRDGRSLTSRWWNVDNAKGERMTGTNTFRRVGTARKGLHLINGNWRQLSTRQDNDAAGRLMVTLDGDKLSLKQPTGEMVNLVLGGPKVRIENDPTDSWVGGRRIDANTIELTGYLGDKPQGTQTLRLNPDGSLTMTSRSPAGIVFESTARKQ